MYYLLILSKTILYTTTNYLCILRKERYNIYTENRLPRLETLMLEVYYRYM